MPGSVLVHGKETRHSGTFHENLTDTMPRALGSHHDHVDILRCHNLVEVDVEAVRKHQCLTGAEVRLHIVEVDITLNLVRDGEHDEIGSGCCICN